VAPNFNAGTDGPHPRTPAPVSEPPRLNETIPSRPPCPYQEHRPFVPPEETPQRANWANGPPPPGRKRAPRRRSMGLPYNLLPCPRAPALNLAFRPRPKRTSKHGKNPSKSSSSGTINSRVEWFPPPWEKSGGPSKLFLGFESPHFPGKFSMFPFWGAPPPRNLFPPPASPLVRNLFPPPLEPFLYIFYFIRLAIRVFPFFFEFRGFLFRGAIAPGHSMPARVPRSFFGPPPFGFFRQRPPRGPAFLKAAFVPQ